MAPCTIHAKTQSNKNLCPTLTRRRIYDYYPGFKKKKFQHFFAPLETTSAEGNLCCCINELKSTCPIEVLLVDNHHNLLTLRARTKAGSMFWSHCSAATEFSLAVYPKELECSLNALHSANEGKKLAIDSSQKGKPSPTSKRHQQPSIMEQIFSEFSKDKWCFLSALSPSAIGVYVKST